jgi:thiol-disulfide isomerase/thioredoxin
MFIIGWIPSISQSSSDATAFLGHYLDKRDSFNAYMAKVDLDVKLYSMDTTRTISANVEIVRAPQDTIFGAWLYIETDSLLFIYNHGQLYRMDKDAGTVQAANAAEKPGLWISSTWVSDFTEQAFITKNQNARTILSNTAIQHRVVDTLIGSWPCKGFYYFPPDQDEFTDQYIFVAIDTMEHMLRKRITSTWFQENEQYRAWTLDHPTYGQQTELTRLNDDLLSKLSAAEKIEYYKSNDSIRMAIDYSSLKGRIMGTTEAIDIKDVDADVILLDFWYSSCYPCMKTIPEINKLYDKFKGKNIAFYGVNIIDDEIVNKARIEKYVRNNPMKYETIMADSKEYATWVTEGYPALLILDKEYELITQHTGFSEDMASELSAIIESHLEK